MVNAAGGSMRVGGVKAKSRFVDHVLTLLERVEYRRVETLAERDEAFKIRYDAYRRENFIEASDDERLYDAAYDQSANGSIFGVFIDGEMASTIRIHVARHEDEVLPSNAVFGDVITPRLRQGRVIVDSTRFATKLELSRKYPELAYVSVRLTWLAAEHGEVDYHLATTRVEHQAFYKRVFGHEAWSEPRDYPLLNRKVVCLGLDFPAHKSRVEERYPFFRSTAVERERIFGFENASFCGAGGCTGTKEVRAHA
jgi:hypothetical protein